MKITIVIADDHQVLRDGLRTLLQMQEDMEVVGEADDGRKAVELAELLSPRVIIMDVSMPLLSGIEAARQIRQLPAPPRILALSMHSDKRFIVEMFRAGAAGYLLKECAFREVADAVRCVMRGAAYVSPRIADTVVEDYVAMLSGKRGAAGKKRLTDREREIVRLVVEGKTSREIASCLELSAKTVETHRANIMEKLGLRSIPELTKYAIREGISPLE